MPHLRESTTAVLWRADTISDGMATEPYEAGWAGEAVVFVTGVDGEGGGTLSVEISPDGMHWVDEGTNFAVPAAGTVTFARVSHFGNWLRFRANTTKNAGPRLNLTLCLKA